ncbi:hypothetical protein LD125_00217 [Mesoplasma sp. JKS002658]|uniref:hypothetical protein n=1 Tax=Mesoplasma whartonense TaxID=2878854 RepID=UPI002022B554|nr:MULTISPECIES: hypothetical protein [unclassified Mesoplasma]MCL8211272.1 hypothetical protein [Mesoplasma sp. JKS002664]MCL8211933.1 hypothetical protein [Mesoplasma sp. JKS002662]MCL8213962.1 hypothetical protein [Mesoplasma sp. JKS002658]MCL8214610.1 hypothetical protein [Mesoplasma sp. JKS002663]MCL8215281.1 hypothetical protein [Mesoplasma sp. JKS002659]
MDFKQLSLEFQSNKTTKVQQIVVGKYQVKWFFEGFEKIISKTSFLSQLALSLDFQLNYEEVNLIEVKIDELRSFYQKINQALIRYLSELDNPVMIKNLYEDFLNNFYKQVKDYLNKGMIPGVVGEIMQFNLKEGNQVYDPQKYDEYLMSFFELNMMKRIRYYLRQISHYQNDDAVYFLLLQAYDQKIIETTRSVKNLKTKAHLGA